MLGNCCHLTRQKWILCFHDRFLRFSREVDTFNIIYLYPYSEFCEKTQAYHLGGIWANNLCITRAEVLPLDRQASPVTRGSLIYKMLVLHPGSRIYIVFTLTPMLETVLIWNFPMWFLSFFITLLINQHYIDKNKSIPSRKWGSTIIVAKENKGVNQSVHGIIS